MSANVITHNGLKAVEVSAPRARGRVYLHGAHVASFVPARAGREILWMSGKSHFAAGKPIRGGVPICFPWFGPKKDDAAAPAHGFARLREWTYEGAEPVAGDAVRVVLGLKSDDETRRLWPQDFSLRMAVTFGDSLTMELALTNKGSSPLSAEEALHTYFAVADVRGVTIRGLEDARYIDKTDGMREKTQAGAITISAETDRVYVNTPAEVVVEDGPRRIRVGKEHSADTVVWNPWVAKAKAMADFGDEEWPGMLCVETCNVAGNALRLAPGESHTMVARIFADA